MAGLLTSPGSSGTYTSLTPTVAATVSAIGSLASTVATARQQVPAVCVMHPRRAYWLATQPDSTGRPMTTIPTRRVVVRPLDGVLSCPR